MPLVDQFILNNAQSSSEIPTVFEKKQYQVINDTNNNSYNSNYVRFETVGLALCDTYLGYGDDAYMSIPIVVACYCAGVNFSASDFMAGFKNSHLSFIDKIMITSDGVSIVQQCTNVAQWLIFEQHCRMTSRDEENYRNFYGYSADTGNSYDFASTADTSGLGLTNNRGSPAVLDTGGRAAQTEVFNRGFFNRLNRFTNQGNTVRAKFTNTSATECGNVDVIDNSTVGYKFFYATVNIKLADLPFFRNFPLSKSTLLTIDAYINTGTFTINKSTAGVLSQSSTNINGCANPIMFNAGWVSVARNATNPATAHANAIVDVANAAITDGASAFGYNACGSSNLAVDKDYQFSIGITSAKINNVTFSHKDSSCKLIVPSYKLSPQIEKSYISQMKKKHYWEDCSNFLLTVAANSTFSTYIGSRPRLTKILIVPMLSSNANTVEPQKSAFTTEPATPSPVLGSLIRDFNVEVGGEMVFRTNVNYGHELFLNQMESCMNGNLTEGLTSGRFSLENWLGAYGYLVVNVRKSEVNYNTDLRVKIQGRSDSKLEMQLSIFLIYEKSCNVNLVTGQLEDIIV
jgi:hypothetical protein